MDRAPRRADPQGRLRLHRPAVRPLQVRRHDHQHGHLPADARAVRPPDPPAHRRRLRRVGGSRPPLPRAGRLDRRHQQVRHRHLDDDVGADRRVRGLPDAPRGQGPRSQGSWRRPRAHVPPGRGHDPAPRGGPPGRLAQRPRVARRAGLRLRADHRPAAARGELGPPPVRVPRGLADPRGHVGPDAGRGEPAGRDGPRGRGRQARRIRVAPARHGRGGCTPRRNTGDGRDAGRVPLPRRPVGARDLRPGPGGPQGRPGDGDDGRDAGADLLRARRQLRDREPERDDRRRGGAGRAPGPPVRAAQAVPRGPLDRARRRGGRPWSRGGASSRGGTRQGAGR